MVTAVVVALAAPAVALADTGYSIGFGGGWEHDGYAPLLALRNPVSGPHARFDVSLEAGSDVVRGALQFRMIRSWLKPTPEDRGDTVYGVAAGVVVRYPLPHHRFRLVAEADLGMTLTPYTSKGAWEWGFPIPVFAESAYVGVERTVLHVRVRVLAGVDTYAYYARAWMPGVRLLFAGIDGAATSDASDQDRATPQPAPASPSDDPASPAEPVAETGP